jgi:HPt (histidine-containing phosphotransfer) domain-containing protein
MEKRMPTALEPESQSVAVINLQATIERLGGDMPLVRDVAQIVVEDAGTLLTDIESALEAGDAERAALSAHSLKGLVSNFNAELCAAAAKAVEQAGHTGDLLSVNRNMPALRAEVDRLLDALKREVLR